MKATISFLRGREEFPESIDWEGLDCAIVESPARVEVLDLRNSPDAVREARTYRMGVAFGATAQLRWYRGRSGLHVVLVSDDGKDLGAGSEPTPLTADDSMEPKALLLWGERVEPTGEGGQTYYYEARIPRKLRYPTWATEAGPAKRLALRVHHYRYEDGGRRRYLHRFAGFVRADAAVTRREAAE